MKKIVILGCENSHAEIFLNILKTHEEYNDVSVIGVYSEEKEEAEKLHEKFGVPVMEAYDALVGEADGVVVTARHGALHGKFVRPYLSTAKAVFIDKPVTIDEDEALDLMRECRKYGVKVSGGSALKYIEPLTEMVKTIKEGVGGKTLSGMLRAPISYDNPHGGFFFYSEHMIAMLGTAYGWFPTSVFTKWNGQTATTIFHYPDYDIVGLHTESCWRYSITHHAFGEVRHADCPLSGSNCFFAEFHEFYRVLSGEAPHNTEEEIIAPVFILNAMARSIASGKEEPVRTFTI